MIAEPSADTQTTIVDSAGRDAGKRFRVVEMPPLDTATFVLRLLAAIRLEGVDELTALVAGGPECSASDPGTVLRLLSGCDASAVRALVDEALTHVQIAPDPQHPGMFRALRSDDIRDLATLGDILGAFMRLHVPS